MLEQIKQAVKEIDGTPWRVGKQSPNGLQNVGTKMGVMVCQTFNAEDAHLIAHAPEWLHYLIQQNEQMKQALEWYADTDNWDVHYGGLSGVQFDKGDKAREALKATP